MDTGHEIDWVFSKLVCLCKVWLFHMYFDGFGLPVEACATSQPKAVLIRLT